MANILNSNIFKTAALLVQKVCALKGEKFSEALAIYMMKILSVHPKYESIVAKSDGETLPKLLSEDCVTMYITKTDPEVLVLKMQVYFDLNFRSSEQFYNECQKNCSRKCNAILERILAVPTNFLFHEVVLNDIVAFVLIQQNVSDEHDISKFSEMKNIVLGILPMSEIPHFLAFSQKERTEYITELAPVTSGIKLYTNWNTQQGQHAINTVVSKLVETVPKLILTLRMEFSQTQELIKCLQGLLKYYVLSEDFENKGLPSADLPYLKVLLAFLNHYSFFYCIMMEECDALAVRSFQLEQAFRQAIDDLRLVLSTEITIPSNVFSYYKEVGILWKFVKNELLFFKSMVTIFRHLKNFRKSAQSNYNEKKMRQLFHNVIEKINLKKESSDKTPTESTELLNVLSKDSASSSCENKDNLYLLTADSLKNSDEVSLEFEGFCPWILVHGEGLLLPVDRKLGLVMYNTRCYGFATADGRNAFVENPDVVLNSAFDFVKGQGHLIVVLKLLEKFGLSMHTEDALVNYFIPPILISSMGCQTDIHPVEEHVDEGYTWNQWWWRKQALKYVDIKTKRTHSTQTDLSHFRRENHSQVYLPKENWSQTKRDGSTVMPKAGIPELIQKVKTSIL